MTDIESSDVLREWQQTAAYWQKHCDTIRTMFAPVTEALIKAAGIVPGQSVLDIAGGAGEPSLTIAERVGPGGSVTFTDAVAEMVAAAQAQAVRSGLTNIRFRQCSASALPFADGSFDAVVCRLGVMFFPDPVAGLREMLRVTKRSGNISLAVWGKSDLNPFSYLINNLVSSYCAPTPTDPNAPGAFRFAEPGALTQILNAAGAESVSEQVLKFTISAPISPDQFWEMRSETSGTLREKLTTLTPVQLQTLAQEVKTALQDYFPEGHLKMPAQMIIANGRKP